ncbi:MAG: PAS domain S-box protein [Bacteroidales bacterium]
MEKDFNKLLLRQIKRHFGSIDSIPEELKGIIEDVNNSYNNYEEDSQLLQNSIEISSMELRDAYQKHKVDAESQKETIRKINEAIIALNPIDQGDKIINEHSHSNSSNLFDSLIKLIEERKQAMDEILKLSKAVEQNPASIVITDINGDIEYVNTKFCNLTGYKKEEVIGENPRILKTKTFPQEYFAELWETILSGNEWHGELQNKKKNGDLYWETALIAPIINDNQKISHFIAIKEDITERKLAESERIKQAGLITSLLDSIPDLIFFKDIDGVYLGCNPSFADFVGKSKTDIIGKTDYDLFDKDIADLFRYNDKEMLQQKFSRHNEEWITYPDGHKVLIDTLKTPYWASDGSLIGILGVSRDITKRQEAEEELRQSSQKFEAIISASPDGIGMASLDGKIQLMSEKLAQIHGYSIEQRDEYLDKTIFDFIDPSNHEILSDNIQRLLSGKKNKGISEYIALKKDNTRFFVDVNSSILLDSDGKPSSILFVERDITERKQSEEALQSKTSLLEAQTNATIDAILIIDLNQKRVLINQRAIDLFAIPQYILDDEDDTVLLKHVVSLTKFPEKFLEKVMYLYEHNREISHDEIEFKNGMILDRYSAPVLGMDGKNYGRIWTFRDITKSKEAEKEITYHAGLISSLLDSIPDIIFFKDTCGHYMGGNPAFFEFSGKTREEIIGKTDYDFFDKQTADYFREQDKIMLKLRKPNHNDLWITYPDGRKILVDTLKTPYLGPDGSLIGVLGISRNITDRKLAEEALKQISTRLALATRAGGVGVWDYDIVNNILLWDDQMFEIYGVDKKNACNAYKTWRTGVHPEDIVRTDSEIKKAIDGEKEFNTEYRIIWPDGSVHNVRVLATVQRNDKGVALHMIGTNWDITEQKKLETVLLNAMQEAENANKSKSLFLANMSHEIRTPLNAIIGFSQLIDRDTQLTNVQKEYITSIIRAGEHLLMLINNILELSKVEAGRVVLASNNVDLYSFFEDIQKIFKEKLESRNLQFIFELSNDLPRIVWVDEHKLRQIVINLIGNAVKFTDEGGIAVRVKIDKMNADKSMLVVEIQDSGCGIAENELNILFKHFVQTTSGIKKSSGTGLGLALSRELAILMGGDINVSSTLGVGSIFTFNVIIKEGDTENIQDISSRRIKCIEIGQKNYRILVVDDKEANLQVAVSLLNLVGFETKEAVNGKDAILKFEEWNPDLILMDMRMPVMDGYEATRLIKATKKGKQIPIIALTASSFEDERKEIETLGMEGYIRKPFRESELFNTIGKILKIRYVYENNDTQDSFQHHYNDIDIANDIENLSSNIKIKILEALAVADIDQLLELIKSIDLNNQELAAHLRVQANKYNYEYIQQFFLKNEVM